ncbi:unnamed protein product, partial [Ectocarpus sp. 8 AP-2014]
ALEAAAAPALEVRPNEVVANLRGLLGGLRLLSAADSAGRRYPPRHRLRTGRASPSSSIGSGITFAVAHVRRHSRLPLTSGGAGARTASTSQAPVAVVAAAAAIFVAVAYAACS